MRCSLLLATLATVSFIFAAQAALPSYSADVTVDVTAEDAAAARERAMRQANRQAVNAIAANFTTREGIMVLNKLTDDQLLNFVKETTVLEEKTSNVRYLAKLRISAHDQLLKQYLQEKNVPLVVSSSAEAIIIPIFRETIDTAALLWEPNNPWRQAWEQNPPTIGSVRFFIPQQKDIPSLTVEQALALNKAAFAPINAEGNIYITEANNNDENGLSVRIVNLQNGKREIFNVNGVLSPALFKQAVEETSFRIADELKGNSIVVSSTPETITILYKFASLSAWLKTEEKISSVNAVENLQINAIGNGRVQFQIEYIGGIETLRKALQSHHLLLSESNNYYTLSNM